MAKNCPTRFFLEAIQTNRTLKSIALFAVFVSTGEVHFFAGFAANGTGLTKESAYMDLHRMIAELRDERQRIDEAIAALERLSAGKSRRRGRPPGWLTGEIERQSSESDADTSAANPPKIKKTSSS